MTAREQKRIAMDKRRDYNLRRRYGINIDQYRLIVQRQGGKCAICGGGSTLALAVDHNHLNGRVRGALCKPCNRILGHWRDDFVKALRAADYIIDDGRSVEDLVAI